MKKRGVAFLLSCTLIGASLMQVSAADFEEQSPEIVSEGEIQAYTDILPDPETEDCSIDLDSSNDDRSVTDETLPEDDSSEDSFSEDLYADEVDMNLNAGDDLLQGSESEDDFADEFMEEAVSPASLTAGQWDEVKVDGEQKFRYRKSDDGEKSVGYYTLADGLVEIDGHTYLFDEDGYMITGRIKYKNGYLFLMDEANAEVSAAASTATVNLENTDDIFAEDTAAEEMISEETDTQEEQDEPSPASEIVKTPYNSNLGQLQKTYWRWTGKAFEYYDEDGYYLSVAQLKAKELAKNTYRGYYQIRGSYFALNDNGVPRTGDYEIKEGIRPGIYYFYKEKNSYGYPGAMALKTWVHVTDSHGERWRYYDGSGRTTLGVKVTKLDKTIDPTVGDSVYLLSNAGYLYKKSVMVKATDGGTYICNAKSVIYKNKLVSYNGARYYVTSSGKLSTYKNSWKRLSCMKNRPYYFGSTPGKVSEKTGWVKVTYASGYFAWYLFTGNGNAYISTWKGNVYFDEKGILASGMQKVNGKMYYFYPSTSWAHHGAVYKNTVITYNGQKYYAGSNGALYQNKWAKINENYYYFQANGTLATNTYVSKNGVYGYVDSTGKYTTGWVIENASQNKVRYLNPDAPGYVKNTHKLIDGVRYYFDQDGYRVTDLTTYYPSGWENDLVLKYIHNGSYAPYYLECDRVNGVITVYTSSKKNIPIKTMRTSVGTSAYPTPTGTYTVQKASRWQLLMGPSWGQYGCFLTIASNGIGIYTHSVASSSKSVYDLPTASYDKLGTPASHGCMRLCVADAKWIYDNCNGAQFRIFDGTYQSQECKKGPLGRNPLVRRYGSGNFDPTDPAVVG